jgi:hypothetical protein
MEGVEEVPIKRLTRYAWTLVTSSSEEVACGQPDSISSMPNRKCR